MIIPSIQGRNGTVYPHRRQQRCQSVMVYAVQCRFGTCPKQVIIAFYDQDLIGAFPCDDQDL